MENEGTTLKAAKREFMSWKSSTKQAPQLITLTQKLQMLTFRNHDSFVLEIQQTCVCGCKLQTIQTKRAIKCKS